MTEDGPPSPAANGDGQSRLRIPGYVPVRGLGVDRAGALVEARALQGGTRVVVRLLSPALAADKNLLRRLRRESGRLVGLRHPNLVGVIRYEAGAQALITEFAGGVTLRRLIDGSGQPTPEAAFALMGNVLAALGALHSVNVLHRDLRPELIYVDAAGVVRVRDAGIPAPPLHSSWTAGTPRYLAPELWDGSDHSVASDIYAATCIFFEALTGQPPFVASDLTTLGAQHRNGQIAEDSLPPSARALVMQGMATEAAARPQSAAVFQRDLQLAGATFFEEGWHQAGETWLSEAAAARLMDPPAVERAAVLIPEEDLQPLPPPEPEPRAPSRLRRRLVMLGAVGAAAFFALCVVLIGVALLGHGGATPAGATQPAAQSTTSPSLEVQASPSESVSPDAGESASPTLSPTADVTAPPTPTRTILFTPVATKSPTPRPTPTTAPSPTVCPVPVSPCPIPTH